MDDPADRDRDVYRVRKRNDEPASGGERAVGYLVPMVICAILGGVVAGMWWAQGGGVGVGRRHRNQRMERAMAVTGSSVKKAAAIGALIGAIFGAAVARKSEIGMHR